MAKKPVTFTLNGAERAAFAEEGQNLLDFLRRGVGDLSPKFGCGQGTCGACTVVVDGRTVLSCLVLAETVAGSQVETAAGIAEGTRLHALQEVAPAVFFSLLVIAVAFLPVFALVDQEGRLFKPLAYTKTLAMAIAAVLLAFVGIGSIITGLLAGVLGFILVRILWRVQVTLRWRARLRERSDQAQS